MASARKPIASDSPSAITPRMTGSRKTGCRAIGLRIGWFSSTISPLGVRTASAQADGPRIITPSRTAWPPIVAADWRRRAASRDFTGRAGLAAARGAGLLEAPLEALDPSARVHELLLARVERVARRADLDVEIGLG